MNKEEFNSYVEDVNKVIKEIPNIVSNENNATNIIIWLVKMLKQTEENLNKYIKEIENNSQDLS